MTYGRLGPSVGPSQFRNSITRLRNVANDPDRKALANCAFRRELPASQSRLDIANACGRPLRGGWTSPIEPDHRECSQMTIPSDAVLVRLLDKMAPASARDISGLMASFRQGDRQAANELIEIFYPQLRRLASRQMSGERASHSWQPTLLVNELYLELIKIKALPPPEEGGTDDKAAFFGLAAQLMRRLLIHHARPLRAKAVNVSLEQAERASGGSVHEIESILERIEQIRPRLRSVVELKVFEGMTIDEIAARLDCSTATVIREWSFARHFLQMELGAPSPLGRPAP